MQACPEHIRVDVNVGRYACMYVRMHTPTSSDKVQPDIQVRLEAAEHEAKLRQAPHF